MMTNASRPVWPWSMITDPAGMVMSSPALAIFSRSLFEHDANNGLSETSYVQCELLRAVSRERLVRRLGPIDAATSAEVSDVLRTLLNLGRW